MRGLTNVTSAIRISHIQEGREAMKSKYTKFEQNTKITDSYENNEIKKNDLK